MIELAVSAVVTFVLCFIAVPIVLGLARVFGIYEIVEERRCHVYILFGKVIDTIEEPGLHFLFSTLGWRALLE